MINLINGITLECWYIFKEAAPFVLFGFFAAGVLKALMPDDFVSRHLGSTGTRSVLKASLFGVPLPLCSCGVIPVAIGLRKQGASKGATASFLVSVPETGVDSIAITWALLDPVMTVVRPVAAFLTAVATGICINLLPEKNSSDEHTRAADCNASQPQARGSNKREPVFIRLKQALTYAFSDLLKDIGKWLILGIIIAGIISYLVPEQFFEEYLGGGDISLLIMLLVGIPLYICASASTPIAAALIIKGLSPGAALVFLLASPATNAATLTVISKCLGKAATATYLSVIALSSLVIGWLVNHLYGWMGIDVMAWVGPTTQHSDSVIYLLSALVLLGLLSWLYLPRNKTDNSECGCQEQAGGG